MLKTDGKFRKSSFSRIITYCVEVAHKGRVIRVRNSKTPNGKAISFNKGEWSSFIKGVKAGEFDLPK